MPDSRGFWLCGHAGTACLALLWTSPAIPLVLGVPLQGLGLMCIAGFASTVGDYLWIAAVSMAQASVLVRPTRKLLRGRFSAARSVSFTNPFSLASSVSFADERCRCVQMPFQYAMFLWACTLGLLLFDEVPSPLTLCGAIMIAGSGMLSWHFEARRKGGDESGRRK